MHKLKCNTCSNSYVGQTGISLGIRHKEHTRYIKTNNPISAYVLHILNNKQEYGNLEQTIELLKPCKKGAKMNCWESFSINVLQKQNLLIKGQKVNDPSSPFELAKDVTLHNRIPTSSSCLFLTSAPHTHN